MRRAAVAALAAVALSAGAAPAAALPILTDEDAAELAQSLADAEAAQGVCYGWAIEVDDATGEFTGVEQGTSIGGPGADVGGLATCAEAVVLEGRVVYTSESSESEDSASIAIRSDTSRPVPTEGLDRLGLEGGDLLGDDDDAALFDMVQALPLLAAEAGAAPFVPFAPRTTPLPAGDMPTEQPGSDWWRQYWPVVVIMAVAGAALLGLVAYGVVRLVARRRSEPSTPSAGEG